MPTKFSLRLAAALFAFVLAAMLAAAWHADRRDRAQLAADLAAAKQALAQDAARQHARDAQLAQTLSTLAAEKRAATTPAQILRDLPRQLPLPTPITLIPAATQPSPSAPPTTPCSSGPVCGPEGLDSSASAHSRAGVKPASASAVIPASDLKPLYDFAIDCRACQAKLAAAQADLSDERAKTVILTRERDEAVRAAKGGSLLRRVARNAKWLAIGAAAGAIAARAHP